METSVQCYLVKITIIPDPLGRPCLAHLETYFLAKSDRDAIKDSFCHAKAFVDVYRVRVMQVQVLDCHLGMMIDGVSQGGIDRLLYDSSKLDDSIIQERPDFIQMES